VTCAAHPAFTPATIVNRALGKAPAPAVRKLTTLGTATRCRHGEYGAPLGAPTERLCGEFHRTRTLHRFRRSPTRTHNANDLRLCTCPDFQPRSHAVYAPRRRHLPLQGALSTAGALAKKKQGRARQHTPSSAPPTYYTHASGGCCPSTADSLASTVLRRPFSTGLWATAVTTANTHIEGVAGHSSVSLESDNVSLEPIFFAEKKCKTLSKITGSC
jgi:hypothetical protein